ncbi:hypothetical protein PENTCL1PPCAC_6957, partial [Pristionchus entomophagus]
QASSCQKRTRTLLLTIQRSKAIDKPEIILIKPRVPTSLLSPSHLQFSLRHFSAIHGAYSALDQNKLTVLFFNLGSPSIFSTRSIEFPRIDSRSSIGSTPCR